MHGSRKISVKAMCPCYKFNDTSQIYCLGVQGAASVKLSFNNATERKAFQKCHCNPEVRSAICILYSILFKENQGDDT